MKNNKDIAGCYSLDGDLYAMIPIPHTLWPRAKEVLASKFFLSGGALTVMPLEDSDGYPVYQFYFPSGKEVGRLSVREKSVLTVSYRDHIPYQPCLIPLNPDGTVCDLVEMEQLNPDGSVVEGGIVQVDVLESSDGKIIYNNFRLEDTPDVQMLAESWVWVSGVLVCSRYAMKVPLHTMLKCGALSGEALSYLSQFSGVLQ